MRDCDTTDRREVPGFIPDHKALVGQTVGGFPCFLSEPGVYMDQDPLERSPMEGIPPEVPGP